MLDVRTSDIMDAILDFLDLDSLDFLDLDSLDDGGDVL